MLVKEEQESPVPYSVPTSLSPFSVVKKTSHVLKNTSHKDPILHLRTQSKIVAMKNRLLLALGMIMLAGFAQAQDKYFTKSGKISFLSVAPLEDIEARHRSVACVLDIKTGSLQFAALVKGFEFENAEMQQHFNEDYLESHRFPRSEFKGQIVNNASVNYQKPGSYPVQVKGSLTIKGITKEVLTNGTLRIDGNNLQAAAAFNIHVADFNIKIPSLVKDKIAKTVKITVDTKLEPVK